MINKILNRTPLDEIGSKFTLERGKKESLNDYRDRIYTAMQNIYREDRYYYEKTFDYITEHRGKNIFFIEPKIDTLFPRILITCAKVYVSVQFNSDSFEHQIEIKDIKFLIDFKEWLESLNLFNIKVLQDNDDWKYLYTKNLMQIDSLRSKHKFELTNAATKIPEPLILDLISNDGVVKEFIGGDDIGINDPSQYVITEDNVLIKYNETNNSVNYEYMNYPLTLKWLPFSYAYINDEDLDYLVLDKCKYDDNNYKNKILNQYGAKLYNKILQKHNTYWGE